MNQDKRNPAERPPSDESIGRPGDWGEKRFERTAEESHESVVRKPGEQVAPDTPVSTPVTQEDYKKPDGTNDN